MESRGLITRSVLVPPSKPTPYDVLPLTHGSVMAGLNTLISSHVLVFPPNVESTPVGGDGRGLVDVIQACLGEVLVPYYPLAGRIVKNDMGWEVQCDGRGAVFVVTKMPNIVEPYNYPDTVSIQHFEQQSTVPISIEIEKDILVPHKERNEVVVVTPQPQPPPSQSRTEIPRAETKQRVRIIPLLQNSEKGSSPSNDCLNENKGSYGLTFDRQNIMSRENSCAASGWVVNQPSGMVGQIPLQIHGMPMVLGPESHVTVFSANQMQRDYEQNNWFQAGPSTVMLVNNANDLNVSDTGFPFVPTAYNQMIVTPGNHHWMGMLPPVPQVNPHPPTFKPALSLAPRVRVRRAVPVCSAPPPLPEEDITETKEVASLQALNQLRL